MSENFIREKSQLRAYLERKNIVYDDRKKTWRCPCHDDNDPSAVLYENPDGGILYCPVCAKSWNIFALAEIYDGAADFKAQLKSVRRTLGIHHDETKKRKPVTLSPDEARSKYSREIISDLAKKHEWGEISGSWKYTDEAGNVTGLDVRFEKPGRKKIIYTFWYDGKSLRWADPPVLIYNLEEVLKSEHKKPVAIHEGAKCAEEAGKSLNEFIHTSFSGGSAKASMADWSFLSQDNVYIYPDDDEPGISAAKKIHSKIPQSQIVRPVAAARTIKPKGADIVEALQVMTPDELTAYILDPKNHIQLSDIESSQDSPQSHNKTLHPKSPLSSCDDSFSDNWMPFKILGIGDAGHAAFITEEGRLQKWALDTLSKNKLMILAGKKYWFYQYPLKFDAIDWDSAIDDVIRESQKIDFDDSLVRGRGAWRDGDKLSYHDGRQTYGEHDPDKIYIRLPRHDIGINDEPADTETCQRIKDIVFRLSFETSADAVRCLGWAALAPFAGALKYRPPILITGPSGSGKSTVQEVILKSLTNFIWADTKETSTAGIRAKIGKDSACVFFEEGDRTTDKMKMNVDDILAFVRSNYTSNSPDAFKGTKDGGWVSYKMNSMFGIASVNPTIENIADENRIFRVNMIKAGDGQNWKEIEKELVALFTEKNCRAVRALTWSRLPRIFTLTEKIIDIIRELTHRDYRSSYADAMLAAAYMVVWTRTDEPTDEQLINMLTKYYALQPMDEHRDEADEAVKKIMNTIIEILHGDGREKLSVSECLHRFITREIETEGESPAHVADSRANNYKLELSRLGLRLTDDGVGFCTEGDFIPKVLGVSHGFDKILSRHPRCVRYKKGGFKHPMYAYHDKKTKSYIVIAGVMRYEKSEQGELPL